MNKKDKTYYAIHQALERLIQERDYSAISVSDIIEESQVSRSTFYAHYKSKDDVLTGLINHIFEHVFSSNLEKENHHDFSGSDAFDYRHIVVHTFCHFGEDRRLMGAIFSSSASHLFIEMLREKSYPLMKAIYLQSRHTEDVPEDIGISLLSGNFVELLKTYTSSERKEAPEEMADYFFSLVK
ncbi:MAG: TetR/AcrR family transcriptional regulator [Bacilli bacterium]|nr:TetR/AcrR family transcriptional regulator [Bacilli bacterium]